MKKLSAVLVAVFVCRALVAQTEVLPVADPNKVDVGFSMGFNTTQHKSGMMGFTVGICSDYPLSKRLSVQPQLLVSFVSYKIDDNKYVESQLLEIPVHLAVKTLGAKVRPFFAAGASFKMDLHTSSSWLFADGGFGVEREFEYCTIAPEFRLSLGKEMQVFYLVINFKL